MGHNNKGDPFNYYIYIVKKKNIVKYRGLKYLMQHLKNPPLVVQFLANSSFSANLQSFAHIEAS